MKYQFLGTAAAEGLPGIFCDCDICEQARKLGGKNIRTRSQSLVNDDLLIDLSADTYFHVIRNAVPIHKIFHCLITHKHSDHFYPQELYNRVEGFAHLKDNRPFNIYGPKSVIADLKADARIMQIINMGDMILHEIKHFENFEAAGYKITPLSADHPSTPDPVIYFIERDGKTILHANDTGYFLPSVWEWLEKNVKHIDFAEFDCTFGLKECRENHMGFNTVLEVRNRLKDMGIVDDKSICVANHFSHNVGPLYEDMKAVSEKENMLTSYDGLVIEF